MLEGDTCVLMVNWDLDQPQIRLGSFLAGVVPGVPRVGGSACPAEPGATHNRFRGTAQGDETARGGGGRGIYIRYRGQGASSGFRETVRPPLDPGDQDRGPPGGPG